MILVVLDTARADHFGPYGGRARTPAFDDLAGRGLLVPRARATAPWTVPSHASIFSGMLPSEHGVTGLAARGPDGRLASLRPAVERLSGRWLPEVLRRAGYATTAISANVWITREMGFDAGFERFVPVGIAKVAPRGGVTRRRLRDALPGPVRRAGKHAARYASDARYGRDFGATEALAAFRSLLAGRRERPRFVFVNVMEAHAPYLPPAEFNPLSGAERLLAPQLVHRYLADAFVLGYNLGIGDLPKRARDTLASLYAGEVAYADRFLGRLVAEIGPALDDTVLVVTSDHGEHLGEGHLLGHQLSLDDRLLDVPFVALGPGVPPSLDTSVFSLTGLPRLIAAAIGLEDHGWTAPGEVAVSQYESGWNQVRRAPEVAERLHLAPRHLEILRAPMAAATDGHATVVMSAEGERVVGSIKGLERLRGAIDDAGGPHWTDRVPEVASNGAYTPDEEAAIEERLRDLGYL